MAKATRHEAVTEVKVLSPERITLELTREEAETLALVTGRVGGPVASARGDMDSIRSALLRVGFASALIQEQSKRHVLDEMHRTIYFCLPDSSEPGA